MLLVKKRLISLIMVLVLLLGTISTSAGCTQKFTVWFDGNGGTLVSGRITQQVYSAKEIVEPIFEKEGYRFAGWDKKLSKIKENTTVRALWENFTVTFNGNGGTYVSGELEQAVGYAKDLVTPIFEKSGYTLSWDKDVSALTEDAVVTAVWTANQYKLTFDLGEEENVATLPYDNKNVTYGQAVGELPAVSHQEKRLVAWLVDGVEINQDTVWNYAEDKTATASFVELISYSITLDYDGGTPSSEQNPLSYKETYATITLNNPTKAGYTFLGWLDEDEEDAEPQLEVTIEQGSTGDKHYRAIWQADEYILTLDANGGSLTETEIEVTYGQPIGALPNVTHQDKRFVGWLIDGVSINANTIWNYAEGKIAVAQLVDFEEYSIKLNYNGGTPPQTPNPLTYKENSETITLNNPTKLGHTFLGWLDVDDISGEPRLEMTIEQGSTGDKHYYAVWQANEYTLTFNANGGYSTEAEMKVTFGQPIGILPDVAHNDKRFIAWLIDNVTINENTVWNYTEDKTAFAHLIELEIYSIKLNYDGGIPPQASNPVTYKETSQSITLNNPTKIGHTFLGWVDENVEDAEPQLEVTIEQGSTGDKRYRAIWQADKFTVTLDAKGGSLTETEIEVTYGQPIGELPVPELEGVDFSGWYLGLEKISSDYVWSFTTGKTLVADYKLKEGHYVIKFQLWCTLSDGVVAVKVAGGAPEDRTVNGDYVIGSNLPTDVTPSTITYEGKTKDVGKDEYSFYGWTINDKKFDATKYAYNKDNPNMTINDFLVLLGQGSEKEAQIRKEILETGVITLVARSRSNWSKPH